MTIHRPPQIWLIRRRRDQLTDFAAGSCVALKAQAAVGARTRRARCSVETRSGNAWIVHYRTTSREHVSETTDVTLLFAVILHFTGYGRAERMLTMESTPGLTHPVSIEFQKTIWADARVTVHSVQTAAIVQAG